MNRFVSPFFMKMYFYLPSKLNATLNKYHISYIGTRPGVQLGGQEDYLSDFINHDEESNHKEAAIHVKYADERPRSHGLFSTEPIENINSVQSEIARHKGIVWRTTISLNEPDAIRLGYINRESWEDMLKSNVPLMADQMGIPESNLRWVAAFHEEKGHPHVHLVIWEKKPKLRMGIINDHDRKQIRKIFVKEIYGQERIRIAQEKTASRDLSRDLAQEDLLAAVKLNQEMKDITKQVEMEMKAAGARSGRQIAPKLFKKESRLLADYLVELGGMLPKKGRLAYKFMPEDVKERVDSITDWMLRQPDQKAILDKYFEAVEMMTLPYSFQERDIQEAKDTAYADIRKRISQLVIKAASETMVDNFINISPEKAQKAIEELSKATGSVRLLGTSQLINSMIKQFNKIGLSIEQQFSVIKNLKSSTSDLDIDDKQLMKIIKNEKSVVNEVEINPAAIATSLKLAGWNDQVINELFKKTLDFSQEKVEQFIKKINEKVSDNSGVFLTENEWKRFAKNLGIKIKYPWNLSETAKIIDKSKKDFLENLKTSVMNKDLIDKEKEWTSFCITVALKEMKVPYEVREKIMYDFANKNNIKGIRDVLDKVQNNHTKFLKKTTWEIITKNLGINTKYPWVTEQKILLDKTALEDSLKNIIPKELTKKEKEWTSQQAFRILASIYPVDRLSNVLEEFKSKSKLSLDDYKKNINEFLKFDPKILYDAFGLKDKQYDILSNFAKVLHAAGMNNAAIKNLIEQWNTRSKSNVVQDKINKILYSVDKYCSEMKNWGRVPFIRKKDFAELNKALKTNAPWFWKSNRSYRAFEQNKSINIGHGLWKAIWKGVEQERAQSEAKAELMKKQQQRAMSRRGNYQEEER